MSCHRPADATFDGVLCSRSCNEHPFEIACDECGATITVTLAGISVVGERCSGCFGYPYCQCEGKHTGPCPEIVGGQQVEPPRQPHDTATGALLSGPEMAERLREAADEIERCPGLIDGTWLLELEYIPVRVLHKVVARDVHVRVRFDVRGKRRETP